MKNRVTEGRDKWVQENIVRLNRELEEGKYNQPPTVLKTAVSSVGIGSPYTIADNGSFSLSAKFNSSTGAAILPIVEYDLYLNGVVSDANRYSTGANWGASAVENTRLYTSWTEFYASSSQIIFRLEFWNFTGAPIDIGLKLVGRYIPSNVLLS